MREAHLKQTISSLNDPANVAAIVLAAGPSRRMGRPKQLLEFRGEILLLAKDHAVMKNQDERDDKEQRNPVVKKKAESDLE